MSAWLVNVSETLYLILWENEYVAKFAGIVDLNQSTEDFTNTDFVLRKLPHEV